VPPTNEQRRIVAKLDRLFARTSRARAELGHIPQLIERYKQAILRKAFSGELTADWRNDPTLQVGSPWDIPKTWRWGTFSDIAEVASNLVAPEDALDLPHIAPNHIESGQPRLLPYNTVREDEVISPKHRFFPGQVIYSKIRPYLRKAVLVDFDGVCSADMYPLNTKSDPLYLLYWLLSPGFNDLAMNHQGRVVLPKINKKALERISTPIPPPDEQIEIGKRIHRAMSWIDTLGDQKGKASKLLENLDARLLAKAFSGNLVPQDPNDEPASELLDRIRTERAARSNNGRNHRRK
jgi:type I restriction enzyme S subunit